MKKSADITATRKDGHRKDSPVGQLGKSLQSRHSGPVYGAEQTHVLATHWPLPEQLFGQYAAIRKASRSMCRGLATRTNMQVACGMQPEYERNSNNKQKS